MADTASPIRVGTIWRGIVAALRPDFATLFALAAPFTLLVTIALELFGPKPPTTMDEFTPRVVVLLLLLPSIVGAIAQLALTWLIATPGGTPRAALGRALKALPIYLAAVVILTPITTLGLVLLVVPGLYLFGRFYLAGAAVVVEGLGPVAALRRSWALTAGAAWTILLFLVLAVLFVVGAAVLSSGIGAAFGVVFSAIGLKTVGAFVAALISALVSMLFTMASAAAGAVLYLRLRGAGV
jgi:hypothetical protein